jgi:hypothetical protein
MKKIVFNNKNFQELDNNITKLYNNILILKKKISTLGNNTNINDIIIIILKLLIMYIFNKIDIIDILEIINKIKLNINNYDIKLLLGNYYKFYIKINNDYVDDPNIFYYDTKLFG